MANIERQQTVLSLLQNFQGPEKLKQLFWSELNYERINQPLPRSRWNETAAKALAEDPLLFAGGGENNDFHIIYARLASDKLLLVQQRPVVNQLLKEHPYALVIFSNNQQNYWHFINIKYDKETAKRRLFRRITVSPEERLRTASERIALLDLASIQRDLFGLSPLQIQERHDEAFDVEKVTEIFFKGDRRTGEKGYKQILEEFRDEIFQETSNTTFSHNYALQFLNRCMFLYFIQRKGWLGSDKEFLRTFWETYRSAKQPNDSFVETLLKEVTVVDIAGGSGSFLVGMLHILDDLQKRADSHLGKHEGSYERKKRIIGQSLYGVDIMDWACHVAELRLWLALIIDAEFTPEELHVRKDPLLPHFSFKIRCGDSLVQEVGGVNLGHIRHSQALSSQLKSRITKLKNEKLKFYNNEPERQFKTEEQIKHEELRLFRDILEDRQQNIRQQISNLKSYLSGEKERPLAMPGLEKKPQQMELSAVAWQKQIEELKSEAEKVEQARSALKTVNDVPFIWDIAFVEIFEDEKEGFDIVIGNPPYVRQENIADPSIPHEKITAENKKAYKAKLARSVYQKFPNFFGYKESNDTVAHKLEEKATCISISIFTAFHCSTPKAHFASLPQTHGLM